MGDMYSSENCPDCNKKNFYWIGNSELFDISGTDIEALICWKCSHKWLLSESEEIGITLDDAYTDEGMEVIK